MDIHHLDDDICVYIADIHSDGQSLVFSKYLSSDEQKKAARFVFPSDRLSYQVAHSLLRKILSEHLDTPPQDIHFQHNLHGKPLCDGIHFNLSHSGSKVAIILSSSHQVGIDIEHQRKLNAMEGIVKRFFSKNDYRWFCSISPDKKQFAFFSRWCEKEAFVKAVGTGISNHFNQFDIAADFPHPKIERISFTTDLRPENCTLRHLELTDDYLCVASWISFK